MRKLCIILILVSISYLIPEKQNINAEVNRFARIERTTEIFKTNTINQNLDNILCLAEETYFVELISDYDNLYKVNYNGITGYIKKTDIKEILNTPITPYPYNIKLIVDSNCNLRSTPTTKSSSNNVISTVYTTSNNITFVGRVVGEEAIDFGGNTWYYVCYNGDYGYIYNNYIKSITPIYQNTENFSYLTKVSNTIENPIKDPPSLIIMIILGIPLFVVLFILYLPNKKKPRTIKQKIIKEIERY